MTEKGKQRTIGGHVYYGWILLVALGVINIIAFGTLQYAFGVLVVPVGKELGWSRTDLSGSYSAMLLVAALLGYPIGRWVDRHGARAALAAGSLLAGLTLIELSRVTQLWAWHVLWGGGLGLAGALTQYPVTFTVLANWFHRRRGSAMALLTVLGGLASPIFLPLAGWLVPRIGWRETLLVFGWTQLGVALPLALWSVRRHPEDVGLFPDGATSHQNAPTTRQTGVGVREALRRVPFWTLTLTCLAAQLGPNVLITHQVAYMIDRGQNPVMAAMLAGLVGVVSLPGRFVFNALSERLPAQWLLGFCQIVLALGVLLLALAHSTEWLIAYLIVYGSVSGAEGGLTGLVRADHFGRRAFGTITALQGYPAFGAAALGPLLAGWLYDRSGTYQLSFGFVVALYVVSAIAMFVTPQPRPVPAGR